MLCTNNKHCVIVSVLLDQFCKCATDLLSLSIQVLEARYCLGLLYFTTQDYKFAKHYFEECVACQADHGNLLCVQKARAMVDTYGAMFAEASNE